MRKPVLWFLAALLVGGVTFVRAAAPVPSGAPPSYPTWWFTREVIKQVPPGSATPAWPTNYLTADDFTAANIGQLKVIASAAFDELSANLPGGPGPDVTALIKRWYQLAPIDGQPASPDDPNSVFLLDENGNRIPLVAENTDDYVALNLGQLKAVASAFYVRLQAIGYCSGPPWANGNADDFATANVGQLKNIFSFDLFADTDSDGVPDWWENNYRTTHTDFPNSAIDWWELYYLGQYGIDPNSLAPSGDGLTLLYKFQHGLNPDVYQDVPVDQQSPVRLIVYTHLE